MLIQREKKLKAEVIAIIFSACTNELLSASSCFMQKGRETLKMCSFCYSTKDQGYYYKLTLRIFKQPLDLLQTYSHKGDGAARLNVSDIENDEKHPLTDVQSSQ